VECETSEIIAGYCITTVCLLKAEQGVIQFYFGKNLCINNNFWWFRIFWFALVAEKFENVQNEITKCFLVSNTKINILTNHG